MNIIDRRQILVEELQQQLELSPTVIKSILKAKPKEVDLSGRETRSHKLGEEPRIMPELPEWASSAICPRCHLLLTPITAKADNHHGENITYQCHNSFKGSACLTVVNHNTGYPWRMVAEDYTQTDFSVPKVAPETVPVLGTQKDTKVFPYKKAPPTPWSNNTVNAVVWNEFWSMYLDKGSVSVEALTATLHEGYPKFKATAISNAVETLPKWMQARTGFVIGNIGRAYVISGRGKGNQAQQPFGSAKYRADFGF